MGIGIQQNTTKVRRSDLKLMGQTMNMLHNEFTVFIYDMLTLLISISGVSTGGIVVGFIFNKIYVYLPD